MLHSRVPLRMASSGPSVRKTSGVQQAAALQPGKWRCKSRYAMETSSRWPAMGTSSSASGREPTKRKAIAVRSASMEER